MVGKPSTAQAASLVFTQGMGGNTGEKPLKVNPKLANKAAKLECMDELQAFFGCMTVGAPDSLHVRYPLFGKLYAKG